MAIDEIRNREHQPDPELWKMRREKAEIILRSLGRISTSGSQVAASWSGPPGELYGYDFVLLRSGNVESDETTGYQLQFSSRAEAVMLHGAYAFNERQGITVKSLDRVLESRLGLFIQGPIPEELHEQQLDAYLDSAKVE